MENSNKTELIAPKETEHINKYYIKDMRLVLEFFTLAGEKKYMVWCKIACVSCDFEKMESRCFDEDRYYKVQKFLNENRKYYTYLSNTEDFYKEFEPRI